MTDKSVFRGAIDPDQLIEEENIHPNNKQFKNKHIGSISKQKT